MKFTTDLAEFQKCLQRVLPAVPVRPPFDELEFFRFELEDNNLIIVASDIEITIKTTIIVTGESNGTICIPARRFFDYLKGLDSSKELIVETSHDNELVIEIISGKTKLKLEGIEADRYIELPGIIKNDPPSKDNAEAIFFEQEVINKLSEKTTFAISKDDYRINMSGVLLQFRSSYMNAVSTDGFRLVRYTQFSGEQTYPEELDLLIPAKTMDILKKIDDHSILSYDITKEKPQMLRIDYGDTVIITKLIKETFPKYDSIIPVSSNCSATFDISAFLEGLKRVAPIINTPNNPTKKCRLEFNSDTLFIITENTEKGGNGVTEIQCEFEGEEKEFAITFNINYLQELISNITPNETNNNLISMYFISPEKAALIKPKSDTDQIIEILMPIRNS